MKIPKTMKTETKQIQVNKYTIKKQKYMGLIPKENYALFRGETMLEHFIKLEDAILFAKNN